MPHRFFFHSEHFVFAKKSSTRISVDPSSNSLLAAMSKSFVRHFFPILNLLLLLITIIFARGQRLGDENCETLMSEIHITKDQYDEGGRLTRTCTGDLSVTKCEGFCNSQVQPSVMTPTGFLKECYCCRESYLKERVVKLNHCYDADGIKLESDDYSTMEIKLREPAECKCYKCGDFSR